MDDELRELQRRWRSSGSLDDEAALLRALRRAHVADAYLRALAEARPERVEAAACLGHEGAQAALGGTPAGLDPVDHWWRGPEGAEARARRRALDFSSRKRGFGPEPRWSRALRPFEPEASLRVAIAALEGRGDAWERPHLEKLLGFARTLLRKGILDFEGSLPTANVQPAFRRALVPPSKAAGRPFRRLITLAGDAVGGDDDDGYRRILVARVAPWLLGLEEPLGP